MAEAVLSTLLQSAFDGLCSLIQGGRYSILGIHKDIENLRSNLSTMLAVIADAEKKQLKDEALKNWLAKLKHVAYDIEDILDQWTTEERELAMQGHIAKKPRLLCSVPNIPFRSQIAGKIEKVNERLEAIAGGRSNFHLIQGARMFETEGHGREKTDSFVIESDVYGRNEDKASLIKILLDVGKEGELSVIPILGMGGLGKTTLAQLIYNDEDVKAHFDLGIWVCVSDDFDVKRLTTDILESVTGNKYDTENVDLLQRNLQEKLKGRKFLLVLDDVWEENPDKWPRLRSFLQAGVTGSKIIVTTRSERVALIMGTVLPYHLGRLSDDDCWTLFKQRAFVPGQEENPKLIVLGKEIVKKCGGIPLAAKSLGSLMRFKKGERQWESIKESEIWKLPEDENGILPALRLSYYQLPIQLKQCFAYCSIFPKDRIIETEELILLWIAEGFIQPNQGSEPMEDIGRDCFNNLLWRSFFQEPEKDADGNVVRCKMHDLMHDLAASVSGDASCSVVKKRDISSISSECRHLSLVYRSKVDSLISMGSKATKIAGKLRTLLALEYWNIHVSLRPVLGYDFYIRLPCLRVLDLGGMAVPREMLNSITQLKQLRYLHIAVWGVGRRLPESFSELHNLQTLRLRGFCELEELPKDMRRMTSLRHLQLNLNSLTHMPAKMGELKYLQTLPVFIVGEQSGCNIRELQDLKLGGELSIRKLENVRGRENAVEAKLNEKANLRSLTFSWSDGDSDADMRGRSEQTLEGLQPHRNLQFWKVENYGGQRFPHWMGSIANLKEVSLSNCRECVQLPPLGQLPFLKSLHITSMRALKCIDSLFYGDGAFPSPKDGDRAFPSLEDLTFDDMPNLEEWSESMHRQAFPCLAKLTLGRCPMLSAIPCFPSLSLLENWGFEGEHIPPNFFQNQSHLSELIIRNCSKLESLPRELGNLAALQKLQIVGCDSLTSLSLQGRFPSLRSLEISSCRNLVSMVGDMHHLTSLETLEIRHCPELGSLPEGLHHLTSLETLDISSCPELGSLPEGMEHLTSLKSLSISQCDKVTCLPEGLKHASMLQHLRICCRNLVSIVGDMQHLTSLETLQITGCRELGSLPEGMEHFTSLKSLSISHCDKVTCLPEGLKHASMLQHLNISSLPRFAALPEWIGNLSSLQSLSIWSCGNLVSLASGLQHLTNLKDLSIIRCPELEKRCKKETGEGWQKIAHIPSIYINHRLI